MRTILTSLAKVNVTDFVDDGIEGYLAKLQNPVLEIGINMYDGNTYYLRIAQEDENKHILQVNNETEHLYLVYKSWLSKFEKTAEDFK